MTHSKFVRQAAVAASAVALLGVALVACGDDETAGAGGASTTAVGGAATTTSVTSSTAATTTGGGNLPVVNVEDLYLSPEADSTFSDASTIGAIVKVSDGVLAVGPEFARVDDGNGVLADSSKLDVAISKFTANGAGFRIYDDCGTFCVDRVMDAVSVADTVVHAGTIDDQMLWVRQVTAAGTLGWDRRSPLVDYRVRGVSHLGGTAVVVASANDEQSVDVAGFDQGSGTDVGAWSHALSAEQGSAIAAVGIQPVGTDLVIHGVERNVAAGGTRIWTQSVNGGTLAARQFYPLPVDDLVELAWDGANKPFALISDSMPGLRLVNLADNDEVLSFSEPANTVLASGGGDVWVARVESATATSAEISVWHCTDVCRGQVAALSRITGVNAPESFRLDALMVDGTTVYLGGGWAGQQFVATFLAVL